MLTWTSSTWTSVLPAATQMRNTDMKNSTTVWQTVIKVEEIAIKNRTLADMKSQLFASRFAFGSSIVLMPFLLTKRFFYKISILFQPGWFDVDCFIFVESNINYLKSSNVVLNTTRTHSYVNCSYGWLLFPHRIVENPFLWGLV